MEEKKTRKIETCIYPEEPRNIPSIDATYIKSYLKDKYEKKEISRKTLIDFKEKCEEYIAAKGDRAYFMSYRDYFVQKFFPQLLVRSKTKSKKQSMVDFLDELID